MNEQLILEALAMILERQPVASIGNFNIDAKGNVLIQESAEERMVKRLRAAASDIGAIRVIRVQP